MVAQYNDESCYNKSLDRRTLLIPPWSIRKLYLCTLYFISVAPALLPKAAPIALPPQPTPAPALAPTALSPSLACSKYPRVALVGDDVLRALLRFSNVGRCETARSRATAVAGVVEGAGAGGGEASRIGWLGGEDGANRSFGAGGAIII